MIQWFRQTMEELRKKNLTDKMMKRTILTAVRYLVIHLSVWICKE